MKRLENHECSRLENSILLDHAQHFPISMLYFYFRYIVYTTTSTIDDSTQGLASISKDLNVCSFGKVSFSFFMFFNFSHILWTEERVRTQKKLSCAWEGLGLVS